MAGLENSADCASGECLHVISSITSCGNEDRLGISGAMPEPAVEDDVVRAEQRTRMHVVAMVT